MLGMVEAADLAPVLILPGLYDSGPEHWQMLWLAAHQGFRRVEQRDWVSPLCIDWVANLDGAVVGVGPDALLVAHSAACALVAHWAAVCGRQIRGALLVAPSDVEASTYPAGPVGFAPMPLGRLPFASTVVASTEDPYVALYRAKLFAKSWGSRFVDIGPAGHINTAARLGAWPAGLELLAEVAARGRAQKTPPPGTPPE